MVKTDEEEYRERVDAEAKRAIAEEMDDEDYNVELCSLTTFAILLIALAGVVGFALVNAPI